MIRFIDKVYNKSKYDETIWKKSIDEKPILYKEFIGVFYTWKYKDNKYTQEILEKNMEKRLSNNGIELYYEKKLDEKGFVYYSTITEPYYWKYKN